MDPLFLSDGKKVANYNVSRNTGSVKMTKGRDENCDMSVWSDCLVDAPMEEDYDKLSA